MITLDENEETYSVMFSSLKHPLRRKILRILSNDTKTFTEILQEVDVESAHLSYHLDSLDGLIKKTDQGIYALSELGRAAVSLMARVEEPLRLAAPKIVATQRRLKVARITLILALLLGLSLLTSGIFAVSSVNFQKAWIHTSVDTDSYVIQSHRLYGFSGFFYQGDGLYGIQVNLAVLGGYSQFPFVVRLSLPIGGNATLTDADVWNQSWYEWSVTDPGYYEELAVTLLARGNSAQLISQVSFDHVHPSPGRIIGPFRPTGSLIIMQTGANVNQNITLSGFRAFQIKWFYFPNPDDAWKNAAVLSGIGLLTPSLALLIVARNFDRRKEAY